MGRVQSGRSSFQKSWRGISATVSLFVCESCHVPYPSFPGWWLPVFWAPGLPSFADSASMVFGPRGFNTIDPSYIDACHPWPSLGTTLPLAEYILNLSTFSSCFLNLVVRPLHTLYGVFWRVLDRRKHFISSSTNDPVVNFSGRNFNTQHIQWDIVQKVGVASGARHLSISWGVFAYFNNQDNWIFVSWSRSQNLRWKMDVGCFESAAYDFCLRIP